AARNRPPRPKRKKTRKNAAWPRRCARTCCAARPRNRPRARTHNMAAYFNLYTLAKKLKRRAQQKKNRHHELMYEIMRIRRADDVRIRENSRRMNPKRNEAKKQQWTDKTAKVRNRLTGKKRDAKERWNRFAGTSDAGSRGR